ncbi:50S ribosomal protein L24 [Dissostichus eleginoides]|uniref:50S ribosomal protein L24 n=1 Tax=Dissostichus eleginoides TaxID=100907 RepID=A0AAD9BKM9_DISEL|nr:50S ribosomal protein L24 [Dissostichus eleginoides]
MDEPVTPIHKEKKFIVFMTCLTRLLTWCHCPDCGSVDISTCHNVIGSLLAITLSCASCYKRVTWNSQPYIGSTPAGNILLSASILLAGATAGKVLRVMRTMALATISSRTYFRHQRSVLLPVVQRVWNMRQTFLLAAFPAEGRDLVLGERTHRPWRPIPVMHPWQAGGEGVPQEMAGTMIMIAALHFNENANRVQGVTKTGEAVFSIKYPKGRKGAAVLRRVLESPNLWNNNQNMKTLLFAQYIYNIYIYNLSWKLALAEYAQELLAEVVKECTDKENVEGEFTVEPVIVPPPLCAQFPHPEKADFVKQHLSRFKKTTT